MKNIKMSAPWYIYFEQLKALFEQDDEVDLDIIEEDEGYKIEIFVADDIKAEAIAKLLPEKKVFGNVEVLIYVYPSTNERDGWIETFADAFEGNPIIEDILPYSGPAHDQNFVVFKKEVVQYYSDNIQSVDGVTSTIYEDIAREVFEDAPGGIFFSTATNK